MYRLLILMFSLVLACSSPSSGGESQVTDGSASDTLAATASVTDSVTDADRDSANPLREGPERRDGAEETTDIGTTSDLAEVSASDASDRSAIGAEVDTATDIGTSSDLAEVSASDASAIGAEVETSPTVGESCNGLDDDGDGAVDEGLDASPWVYLDALPAYCSDEALQGGSCGASPEAHRVALFIRVGGWFNKPTWNSPSVALEQDGSWSAQIVSAPYDVTATEICAFLVPADADLPLLDAAAELPASLFDLALSWVCAKRDPMPRKLEFGGYVWGVKSSCGLPVGPGPCIFSDDETSVWLESGSLHLVAKAGADAPTCAEVVLEESLGFGEYRFTVAGSVDTMDPNAVVGLFTYDLDPAYSHREIDVELARWGLPDNDNAQFVVQPHTITGNIERFHIADIAPTTHKFRWQPGRILFRSLAGTDPYPAQGEVGLACWAYTGADLPPEGSEQTRINLWWLNGVPGSSGVDEAVVVSDFTYLGEAELATDETCTIHP